VWTNPGDSIFGGSNNGGTTPPPTPDPVVTTDLNFPFQQGNTQKLVFNGGEITRSFVLATGVAPGNGFIPALGWRETVPIGASFNTVNVFPSSTGELGTLGARVAIAVFKQTQTGYTLLGKTPVFEISNVPDEGVDVVIAQPLGTTVELLPGDQIAILCIAIADLLLGDTDSVADHGLQAVSCQDRMAQLFGATGASYNKPVTTNINPYNASPARIGNIATAEVGDQIFLADLLAGDLVESPLRDFPLMRLYTV
jgi:hypothetical protein